MSGQPTSRVLSRLTPVSAFQLLGLLYQERTIRISRPGPPLGRVTETMGWLRKTCHQDHYPTHFEHKVQRNKVSNYFYRKSDDISDITTPVGCTIAPTNPTRSLGTPDVSGNTHPNRQTASMGAHTQDHSADHGLNISRHVKLPSELLDVDTQDTSDHTVNTTDNMSIHKTHQTTPSTPLITTLYVQCSIVRASHTRPLMTLFGAQGDGRTEGDQTQQFEWTP